MTPHLHGTADEIRARVPAVFEAYRRTRDTVLRSGVADQRLKERCFAYLATGKEAIALDGFAPAEPQNYQAHHSDRTLAPEHVHTLTSNQLDDWRQTVPQPCGTTTVR